MSKKIYYPKNLEEYKDLINNLDDFSIFYPLKNSESKNKNIINLSYLNKMLEFNENLVEFEAGENLYNIENFLNTKNKTIHPFDKIEVINSIKNIKNNAYSVKYNVFDTYYSKRIYFSYKELDKLLANLDSFDNFNISIYNEFATLCIKYYKEILMFVTLWNNYRDNFYYETNYSKRIKYLLILKDIIGIFIDKYSIACNVREKIFIPISDFSYSFKRKRDNFKDILYFFKNEFDFISMPNKIIEIELETKNIRKIIEVTKNIKEIFISEIKLLKKIKLTALLVGDDDIKILSFEKQLNKL